MRDLGGASRNGTWEPLPTSNQPKISLALRTICQQIVKSVLFFADKYPETPRGEPGLRGYNSLGMCLPVLPICPLWTPRSCRMAPLKPPFLGKDRVQRIWRREGLRCPCCAPVSDLGV